MDSNKDENLSISSTKDSIIWSELATKTNLKSNFEVFFMLFIPLEEFSQNSQYKNLAFN